MLDFFRKNSPILGVDIGTRTIKGVKLKKEKDGRVHLDSHFFQDLSLTSEEFPKRTNIDEAFKAAIEIQRLGASQASTTIRDSEVLSFNFSLPEMTDKELDQAVPQEVAEQGQLTIDDYVCDYLTKKEDSVQEIKAYCVKRDLIMKQTEFLKKAGLKPKAIETEMMAIFSMLKYNDYVSSDEVAVVLDLGESHISSGLIADGVLALSKSHEGSFGMVNSMLKDQLDIDYEHAEEIKADYDFLSVPEESEDPILKVMDQSFTVIFKKIKEIIDFYRECHESYGRVDHILLVGGGSQIKNIDQIHETFFQITTTIVNPFRNIEILSDENPQLNDEVVQLAPYMATAVGLALASIPEEKRKLGAA